MDNTTQDKKSWLQELSNQSWNLEFVVSGAAIFSTSFLPDLTEKAISYYFENYQADNDLANFLFPTLAFSFAKASAYLLITTFIIHFTLRAFWIGMIGLRAVYPQGIIFENLPNTNKELRELYKQWFGTFDDFIVRLDKRCSQIFSIAFLLVLFSVLIAVAYLLIFMGIVAFKTYNPALYLQVKKPFLIVFLAIFAMNAVLLFFVSQEKYREHPIIGKWYVRMVKAMTWLYFGLYKPLNYINFIFASNLSRKRYFTSLLLLAITFTLVAITISSKKTFEQAGLSILESRSYYSSGSADYQLKSAYYENNRIDGEEIAEASIQADVIKEPFIKLFINYKKVLDANLSKIYKEPKIPESLNKYEKRSLKDKARLESFEQYFQIALNDSTLRHVEFLYEAHGPTKTKGLATYLSTEKCKIGRNTLYIKALQTDSLPKKIWKNYVSIPFWFAKD